MHLMHESFDERTAWLSRLSRLSRRARLVRLVACRLHAERMLIAWFSFGVPVAVAAARRPIPAADATERTRCPTATRGCFPIFAVA